MNKKDLKRVMQLAESLCNERGVRLTSQRKAVLQMLLESEKPLSAYDLLDQMRQVLKKPAPPTVYRALDFLLEQGLAHKIESIHAYVGCVHPEHPHASQFLICADCGEVAEVEDKTITQSLENAGKAIGFNTTHPVVELMGTCADCTAKKSDEP